MLERIQGTVELVDEGSFVLRTGGFSLRFLASRNLTDSLVVGRVEDLPVELVIQLEGNRIIPIGIAFPDLLEREVFGALVSVPGVGARAAVKALARPAGQIASAVVSGDEKFLSTLPGIGKARARQIVAALQEKLSKSFAPGVFSADGGADSEAGSVLLQLGLSVQDVESLLSRAHKALSDRTGVTASDLVREAMKARAAR